MICLVEMEMATALAPLQSAVCVCRIAFGLRAGQKILTLKRHLHKAHCRSLF
ncbi:MAG: hypothetical protein Q7T85_05150 [Nitrosomonas sp.]|nr:hypothetical protein [Nitrosomonas sp.]